MKNRKYKNKQGFTLIELAVSSAIIAVIFGGITLFGVQAIRSYQRTRALKNSVENASYAIEILNKTIRTSHKIDGDNNKILFVFDNNDKEGYCYKFDNNKLAKKADVSSLNDCNNLSAYNDIIGDNEIEVTGRFSMKKTDRDENKRGFVRTSIVLKYPAEPRDNFSDDKIIIQSSVSLRDYGYDK